MKINKVVNVSNPILGVTPIMDWIKENYDKSYAPNTREVIRRQTLHQFVNGGVCLYNPDDPARPTNSPKACYQISPDAHKVIASYKTSKWEAKLNYWNSNNTTLVAKYKKSRNQQLVPLVITRREDSTLALVHTAN